MHTAKIEKSTICNHQKPKPGVGKLDVQMLYSLTRLIQPDEMDILVRSCVVLSSQHFSTKKKEDLNRGKMAGIRPMENIKH
jgi:hypothetical protein